MPKQKIQQNVDETFDVCFVSCTLTFINFCLCSTICQRLSSHLMAECFKSNMPSKRSKTAGIYLFNKRTRTFIIINEFSKCNLQFFRLTNDIFMLFKGGLEAGIFCFCRSHTQHSDLDSFLYQRTN